MVSNQYDQFCVGGVPEHPVEAVHVVLPVLQPQQQRLKKERDKQKGHPATSFRAQSLNSAPAAAHRRPFITT